MPNRKPGYVIGVILVGIAFSVPPVAGLLAAGWNLYQWRGFFRPISIFGPPVGSHILEVASFGQDKFLYVCGGKRTGEFTIMTTNPETGETSALDLAFSMPSNFTPFVACDRIWVLGMNRSFEVVDGALQDSKLTTTGFGGLLNESYFLWDGEPAVVGMKAGGFPVSFFQNGSWTKIGHVDIPDFGRERMFGEIPIHFVMGTSLSGTSQIRVLESEDGLHVFLHNEGRLFHHKGLDLNVEPLSNVTSPVGAFPNRLPNYRADLDPPVSALKASNSDADLVGWSLIGETAVVGNQGQICAFGLLIAGQPAALIVENAMSGNAIGHVYRLEGAKWNEFDSLAFPFGSFRFRTVTTHDGQRSYVVTTTATGVCRIYALEATGIRKTNYTDQSVIPWVQTLIGCGQALGAVLILGIALGAVIGILMERFTTPDFEFGIQTVRLASLASRAISRLIDLGLIGATTFGLGWLLTRGFDWQSWVEALNMNAMHWTIPFAQKIAVILGLWLVAMSFGMLIAQGNWGVTPGKWLCRLKTVRTSLRPCGFSRSLAREIVFFVDCCNFLCWTPGIVSIALTDRRQRLGDLVADTIVIRSGKPTGRTAEIGQCEVE